MPSIIILVTGYILSQFYRAFLAVLASVLTGDLGISTAQLSLASGMWFIVFALAQFPVGKWLDEYGPKRTAGWLLLAGGAGGMALFSLATTPWMIIVAMGLIGLGCSPVLMAMFFIFAKRYSPARFAFLSSLAIGIGGLGNIAGTQPLAWAVESLGWRNVALLLAIFTGLVAALIFVLVKDPESRGNAGKSGNVLDLFKIRGLWLIFPIMATLYGVAAGIRGLWIGPFLQDQYALDISSIGLASLAMALALSLGSILYGPLDHWFNTRKKVVLAGSIAGLIVLALFLVFFPPGLAITIIAFSMIGLFCSSYGVIMAHGKAFIPEHLTGRGVTLLNFFCIGGTGFWQFVSGGIYAAIVGAKNVENGYFGVFIMYFLALASSTLIYAFVKDAPPQEK